MESSAEKKIVPILPYDITVGEAMTMYDALPYIRNLEICGNDKIKMLSGNVVKFFHCCFDEPVSVGGDPKGKTENKHQRL